MELAFLEAEARKRKDDATTKHIGGCQTSIPKKTETAQPSPSTKAASQSNTVPVNPVKAKNVSLPSPAVPNKKAPIGPPQAQNRKKFEKKRYLLQGEPRFIMEAIKMNAIL
jgi:hypothetical protein